VHAVALPVDLELGEDHRELGVGGGVADVVLAARLVGGGDHELLGRGVVRRHRAEGLHVGAVPALGHREAAHRAAGHEVGEVGVVVVLRAELEDRAAEQAELDADLHQHREVAEGEGLEGRDRGADVAPAAVLGREAHAGLPGPGHRHDDVLDPLAEVGCGHLLLVDEDLRVLGEVAPDEVADLAVAAVEQRPEGVDVDLGLPVALVGGDVGVVHVGRGSLRLHGGHLVERIGGGGRDLVGGHG
jgi:hypothetical protein